MCSPRVWLGKPKERPPVPSNNALKLPAPVRRGAAA
jgi:hypothetical protein